jgi:hypothetical protein
MSHELFQILRSQRTQGWKEIWHGWKGKIGVEVGDAAPKPGKSNRFSTIPFRIPRVLELCQSATDQATEFTVVGTYLDIGPF